MIIKNEQVTVNIAGMSWDEVCTILSTFKGISEMPIYWHPGGTVLVFGTDEDGNNLIVIR